MKLKGIVICGAGGRMGRMVAEAALTAQIPILGGLENSKYAGMGSALGSGSIAANLESLRLPGKGVVAVEFTTPGALAGLLPALVRRKIALVSGTTGITQKLRLSLKAASKRIPILRAGNFSRGVALMRKAIEALGAVMPRDFDVEIVEAHHSRKMDAPSGTALDLYASLKSVRPELSAAFRPWGNSLRGPGSVGIHSVRGGTLPGEHTVYFLGPSESLRISHVAESREAFARGAVAAAKFLASRKPGLYSAQDIYA